MSNQTKVEVSQTSDKLKQIEMKPQTVANLTETNDQIEKQADKPV